jgi:hypothetical protein
MVPNPLFARAIAFVTFGLTLLMCQLSLANDEGEIVFVRRVLPLLQSKCAACHSEGGTAEGDLALDSRDSLLRGGASGEALIVPMNAEQSPLFLAIARESEVWSAMPPKDTEKLTPQQINWVKQWIEANAPWPSPDRIEEIRREHTQEWSREDGMQVATSGGLSAEWTNRSYDPEGLWAYQPLRKPEAKVGDKLLQGSQAVDYWIEQRLPVGLTVAPPCDARTFIRRATYDLTGLPPTSDEIIAFEHAYLHDSERAVSDLIERLLQSPHYGERIAQHWLDVVRYADSAGFANDYERGNAWRYRDYVIRAFNQDLPYDQFVRQQIAGDEIEPVTHEALIATGFLRMGPWELTGMEVAKIARQRFLDDITNSVGECFLAHSLQCARCHDHKFDPVPTRDYYSIQAVFSNTQIAERAVPFLESENRQGFAEEKYLQQKLQEHEATLAELDQQLLKNAEVWFEQHSKDPSEWNKTLSRIRDQANSNKEAYPDHFGQTRNAMARSGATEDSYPPKLVGFTPEQFGLERVARKGIERLQWELDRYREYAHAVYSGPTPQLRAVTAPLRMTNGKPKEAEWDQTAILIGGDPFSAGPSVGPGVLSAVGLLSQNAIPETESGKRLALSNWIVDPQNPLTARVMVNRLWLWHFGIPIAGNPNNFGSTGKRPTHPELLDWLAASFTENGWSIKQVHRWILCSQAYRRSCVHPQPDVLQSLDPLNTSYARFQPRRLTAEEIRDSMLMHSGELNLELGGIPCRPEINLEAALQPRMVMGTFAAAWAPNPLPNQRHRRSIYILRLRGLIDPALEVFNSPPLDFSCERREVSTVTPQVFSLLNSENSYKRSLALANRVLTELRNKETVLSDVERATVVRRCFQMTFGREPSESETQQGVKHWISMLPFSERSQIQLQRPPVRVEREAIEENTGERFLFTEMIYSNADFVPDLLPSDCDAEIRALAELCLVLFNSNEFIFVY